MTRGIMGDYESYIQIMYQNWYKTQTETYQIQEEYLCSWLILSIIILGKRNNSFNCCWLRYSVFKYINTLFEFFYLLPHLEIFFN